MKLAVIGSREFNDFDLLCQKLDALMQRKEITLIISGGARGADSLAERYARDRGIPTQVLKPDWEKFGKSAGFRRNMDIIEACEACIAFWDGESKGTLHSIGLAKKKGVPVKVIEFKS